MDANATLEKGIIEIVQSLSETSEAVDALRKISEKAFILHITEKSKRRIQLDPYELFEKDEEGNINSLGEFILSCLSVKRYNEIHSLNGESIIEALVEIKHVSSLDSKTNSRRNAATKKEDEGNNNGVYQLHFYYSRQTMARSNREEEKEHAGEDEHGNSSYCQQKHNNECSEDGSEKANIKKIGCGVIDHNDCNCSPNENGKEHHDLDNEAAHSAKKKKIKRKENCCNDTADQKGKGEEQQQPEKKKRQRTPKTPPATAMKGNTEEEEEGDKEEKNTNGEDQAAENNEAINSTSGRFRESFTPQASIIFTVKGGKAFSPPAPLVAAGLHASGAAPSLCRLPLEAMEAWMGGSIPEEELGDGSDAPDFMFAEADEENLQSLCDWIVQAAADYSGCQNRTGRGKSRGQQQEQQQQNKHKKETAEMKGDGATDKLNNNSSSSRSNGDNLNNSSFFLSVEDLIYFIFTFPFYEEDFDLHGCAFQTLFGIDEEEEEEEGGEGEGGRKMLSLVVDDYDDDDGDNNDDDASSQQESGGSSTRSNS